MIAGPYTAYSYSLQCQDRSFLNNNTNEAMFILFSSEAIFKYTQIQKVKFFAFQQEQQYFKNFGNIGDMRISPPST